jgi:hypothetical protein
MVLHQNTLGPLGVRLPFLPPMEFMGVVLYSPFLCTQKEEDKLENKKGEILYYKDS